MTEFGVGGKLLAPVDTIGVDTLTRSPLALADPGRVVAAWGKNAAYHVAGQTLALPAFR